MIKKNVRLYLFQGICAMVLVLFCLVSYLITNSLRVAEEKLEDEYLYVSHEVLTDNVVPVISENETTLIKPYKAEGVSIAKSYYDYKAEASDQENAIVYYQDTYIQNNGVDYAKETSFEVLAVLSGRVISVTEDDIVGKTVKIEHDNNIISVYQSLGEVNINVDEKVNQGQIIGVSGENAINSTMGNHLHFELYYANRLVNPEDYYGKKLGEF